MNTSIDAHEMIYKSAAVQVYQVKIYCSFSNDMSRDIKMVGYAKKQLSYMGFDYAPYDDCMYFRFLNSAHALDFAKVWGNLTDKEVVHYTLMCI
jgi:hypothetical protein